MTDRGKVVEVDVAAVVAEELARHAPGTAVAGQESGGVQVIRVTLDLAAFRRLLTAIAGVLESGSHVRLDAIGGVVHLDVTGCRPSPVQVDRLRALARAMDGHVVMTRPVAEGFSVRLPSGLSEWE